MESKKRKTWSVCHIDYNGIRKFRLHVMKNLNIICNFLTSIHVNVTYAEFNMMTKPECLDVLGLLVYGRT